MLPAALTVVILVLVLGFGVTFAVKQYSDQNTAMSNLAKDVSSVRNELSEDVKSLEATVRVLTYEMESLTNRIQVLENRTI